MPRGDGTGPMGMGRMTGRGAGFCAGFPTPGYSNPISNRYGFGRGRGFRRMFYATGLTGWERFGYPSYPDINEEVADEKEFLNQQVEYLEDQLQQIKKRLSKFKENDE